LPRPPPADFERSGEIGDRQDLDQVSVVDHSPRFAVGPERSVKASTAASFSLSLGTLSSEIIMSRTRRVSVSFYGRRPQALSACGRREYRRSHWSRHDWEPDLRAIASLLLRIRLVIPGVV
jgi:hypothetical protein